MKNKNQQIKETLLETFEKRKSQTCKVFNLKIQYNKLNTLQKEQLKMIFVEAKWFHNHCLAWSKEENNSIFKLNASNVKKVKHFNVDKEEVISELNYLGSSMKASILKQMCSNIKTINTLIKKGFQDHSSYLQFKKEYNSICLKQYGVTHKILSKNKIKIQGVKKALFVNGLEQFLYDTSIEIANFHILKKPDGYYIQATTFVDTTTPKNKQKLLHNSIAIDFGCETSFTTSDGEKIDIKIKETERLKRLQKKLFRQKKGSNSRYKTKQLIQKEYQKISNRKDDYANKLVHKFKQHKTIIIQDEQLKNWHKNGHGKAVQYSILGRVKSKLKELKNTIILDKFIPTTKFCHKCGEIKKSMPQHKRKFICTCGENMDRDVHAAKNMLWIYNALNLVPMEHRDFKRVEFLTAVEAIFKYSGDKLLEIQDIIEDYTYEPTKEETDKIKSLFETMKLEATNSLG